MRVNTSIVAKASRDDVWDLISDPDAYREFMSGFTRWELDGDGATDADRRMRLGSRIRMLIHVGSAQVGGLIEVVECKRGADIGCGDSDPGGHSLQDCGQHRAVGLPGRDPPEHVPIVARPAHKSAVSPSHTVTRTCLLARASQAQPLPSGLT